MTDQFKIEWHDAGREPKSPPNPAYPNGIDLDISGGLTVTCTVPLVSPARRCGFYDIECRKCGATVGVTTAGRPDDPRSCKIGCWNRKMEGKNAR